MSLAESAELIEMPFGVVDLSGLKELDISGGVVWHAVSFHIRQDRLSPAAVAEL